MVAVSENVTEGAHPQAWPSTSPPDAPAATKSESNRLDVRNSWQVVAGSMLIPLGVVFILLAWYGAAHARVEQQQIPYMVSGSFAGLGCMVVGGLLYWGHWLYRIYDQAELHHEEQQQLMVELLKADRGERCRGGERCRAWRRGRGRRRRSSRRIWPPRRAPSITEPTARSSPITPMRRGRSRPQRWAACGPAKSVRPISLRTAAAQSGA